MHLVLCSKTYFKMNIFKTFANNQFTCLSQYPWVNRCVFMTLSTNIFNALCTFIFQPSCYQETAGLLWTINLS